MMRSLATLAAVLLVQAQLACAQAESLAHYSLGGIPEQTVWHGNARSFLVRSGEAAGVSFVVSASPAPQGTLTLEAHATPNWLFRYEPAPQDVRPFEVTITASQGQPAAQTFTIAPQQVLPPETTVFATGQHTQPVVISTSEVSVFDIPSRLPENLNYLNDIVRNVQVVGDEVVIEAGHPNGLFEAYCNGDRRDIQSLEIIADRVLIRSAARLKQTAVTITARELVFEGEGMLKTTPEERISSPGETASGGADGKDGLPAGDVVLNIGALITSSDRPVLDLTGGRGQQGGPGQHGSPGASVSPYWPSVRWCDSGACKTHTPPSGTYITYYYYTALGITVSEEGTKTRPEDGKNAKPSGKPGEGGAAGNLRSSTDISGAFVFPGGVSGAAPTPTAWPYTYFQGGAPGTPQKSEHVRFYYVPFSMRSEVVGGTHTTKAGADAARPTANTAAGTGGTYEVWENPFAWVHPLSLRKVLHQIQDLYLANEVWAAGELLAYYHQVLADFAAHPSWGDVPPAAQLELAQLHGEIIRLRHQLEGGLDYFGNPAGWVPMLSFEVTLTLFENEIDRAIDQLYLTYWIGNKAATEQQQLDAMGAARNKLRDQLVQARDEYDDAMLRLPVLRTKAADLDSAIQTTQNKLEAKSIELLNDTREEDWVTGVRLGLKLSAMMCQMIPAYQPALGAVGEGLRLASDFDPDRPWDSIKSAPNIGKAYAESGFESSVNQQKVAKDGINPAEAEAKSFDYIGALKFAGKGLTKGVADIQGFIEERKAPSAEMLAELERLKSRSPEYQALLQEVEELMERNRRFTEELLTTMQRIATLSEVMSRNLFAIDALNREIAPGAIVLDARATTYLQEMERRALDRLLKYHYYMAKAYEYRLLRPYTEALDLEGLFNKFKEIAGLSTNPDHQITADQFRSLKAVYQDKIGTIAETIFDDYISNRPELSVPVRFSLTEAEIAALNAGQTVTRNLYESGLFPLSQENIRIVDLQVFSMSTEAVGGNYGSTAYVDLQIEHSGISNLKQDSKVYRFRHYNRLTENPIVWGGRYDPVDSLIDPIRPSLASDSLLGSLLSGDAISDMLLYSRPSAWADLSISRFYFDSSGREIRIRSVRLEMVCDFTPRNVTLGQHNLEVLVSRVALGEDGAIEPVDYSLLPLFVLERPDLNNRQNARGGFLRVYPSGTGAMTLSAPPQYGLLRFYQWTDRFGNNLPGGPLTNPSIQVSLHADLALMAQYILPPDTAFVFQPPALSAGNLVLRWNGNAQTRLQNAPSPLGPWQEVPGTTGLSEITVDPSTAQAYFRVFSP
jgi:predicted  nucleic acid-binding Zn-ribbon protein